MDESNTVGIRNIGPLDAFSLNRMVNKSCNTESCGNKMHQIVANMIVSVHRRLQTFALVGANGDERQKIGAN